MGKERKTRVIGLMSGTSLDGLDICMAAFQEGDGHWKYEIERAETIAYSKEWIGKLLLAEKSNGTKLMQLHSEYGAFLGKNVKAFLQRNELDAPKFVASHGHTIFHQPARKVGEIGYTFQLGHGAALTAACGIPVVSDFRTLDVALGGQGAPLVPIGDALLFSDFEYCLNLGGIANISFDANGKRIAYDICPVNYVLNKLANRLGMEYDDSGKIASSGKVIPQLLEKLNALPYYHSAPPKSIGREWMEEVVFPLLSEEGNAADLSRTFVEHIAQQISASCKTSGKMLMTGGGAFHSFLIERLREISKVEIVLPSKNIIGFKEALVFGFLGLLRWENRINTLASVTGASQNSSGGSIYC